jgi:5-bromo-4-chloroindolyl phosphate hydrolysis protein
LCRYRKGFGFVLANSELTYWTGVEKASKDFKKCLLSLKGSLKPQLEADLKRIQEEDYDRIRKDLDEALNSLKAS